MIRFSTLILSFLFFSSAVLAETPAAPNGWQWVTDRPGDSFSSLLRAAGVPQEKCKATIDFNVRRFDLVSPQANNQGLSSENLAKMTCEIRFSRARTFLIPIGDPAKTVQARLDSAKKNLVISEIKAQQGEGAGLRFVCATFKVKNASDFALASIKIKVYFLDNNDKPFFESGTTVALPFGDEKTGPLKPNYSRIGRACAQDGETDIKEWKEGAVKVELEEIETE